MKREENPSIWQVLRQRSPFLQISVQFVEWWGDDLLPQMYTMFDSSQINPKCVLG